MASGKRYSLADYERTVNSGAYPGGPTLAYSKRRVRGARAGKTAQQSRGHLGQEHKRRLSRIGSEAHAKLVARVRRHFARQVGAPSKYLEHFDELPSRLLREMEIASAEQIRKQARKPAGQFWSDYVGVTDEDLEEINEEFNPFWYHSGGGDYPL